jgi:hypothetical protein
MARPSSTSSHTSHATMRPMPMGKTGRQTGVSSGQPGGLSVRFLGASSPRCDLYMSHWPSPATPNPSMTPLQPSSLSSKARMIGDDGRLSSACSPCAGSSALARSLLRVRGSHTHSLSNSRTCSPSSLARALSLHAYRAPGSDRNAQIRCADAETVRRNMMQAQERGERTQIPRVVRAGSTAPSQRDLLP